MDDARFEQMVARLEEDSRVAPGFYKFKVALLALAGLGILALIVGIAGAGIAALAAAVVAFVLTGGKAFIVLLKLGKLLILLAVPLWVLISTSVRALFMRLPPPEGRALERAEAPALFAAMDEMRKRMKGPRFHHVLITDEVNAAVVQRPLFGLFGFPRNYLILGLPLLEAMSPKEAMAVVAHEYGHLAGSHSRFGAYIYRLRLSWARVYELGQSWEGLSGRILQTIVGWYAPYFNAYTFVLARANEYEADRASVDLVGASAAARALKRVNLAAPRYDDFIGTALKRIAAEPKPPADLARAWSAEAATPSLESAERQWLHAALERVGAIHDTHPALAQRLSAMPGEAKKLDELPPPVGETAAARWLGAAAGQLRDEFGRAWSDRVAPAWRARHQELAEQARRLAELSAVAAPNRDERLELVRLRDALVDGFDAVAGYAEFNALHPDDPVGLFGEGRARLERKDATGLALLDRAMALDPDAILPACELAFHFLNERNDKRAEHYERRWRERQQHEHQRSNEIAALDPDHELQPAKLEPDELKAVRALLAEHGAGVVQAYFAQRIVPTDPSVRTHVLAIKVSWWAGWRDREGEIVARLAEADWPVHAIVCVLEGRYARMETRLKAMRGVRLK